MTNLRLSYDLVKAQVFLPSLPNVRDYRESFIDLQIPFLSIENGPRSSINKIFQSQAWNMVIPI